MDKLERIDALLELNVLIGELGLIFNLTQLFLDQLLGTLRKWREARAIRTRDRQQVSASVRQPVVQNAIHGSVFSGGEWDLPATGSLEVGKRAMLT